MTWCNSSYVSTPGRMHRLPSGGMPARAAQQLVRDARLKDAKPQCALLAVHLHVASYLSRTAQQRGLLLTNVNDVA